MRQILQGMLHARRATSFMRTPDPAHDEKLQIYMRLIAQFHLDVWFQRQCDTGTKTPNTHAPAKHTRTRESLSSQHKPTCLRQKCDECNTCFAGRKFVSGIASIFVLTYAGSLTSALSAWNCQSRGGKRFVMLDPETECNAGNYLFAMKLFSLIFLGFSTS